MEDTHVVQIRYVEVPSDMEDEFLAISRLIFLHAVIGGLCAVFVIAAMTLTLPTENIAFNSVLRMLAMVAVTWCWTKYIFGPCLLLVGIVKKQSTFLEFWTCIVKYILMMFVFCILFCNIHARVYNLLTEKDVATNRMDVIISCIATGLNLLCVHRQMHDINQEIVQ